MSCNALTPEEDFALTKAVQDKGTSCDEMNKLHEVYDSFVVSVAKQYLDKGLSLDELVEAGKSGQGSSEVRSFSRLQVHRLCCLVDSPVHACGY